MTTAVATALVLGGCQTTNIGSILPGGYLSDKDDKCYAQRAALDSTGNTFETEVLRNVLLGAGAGALGALLADENPFVGAGLGAAAALAGTLLYDLQRQTGNSVELTEAAIKGVREENTRIDLLLTRFEALRGCRYDEAQDIREALDAGRITRAVAEERMAAVRERYQEDVRQMERIASNISDRTEGYAAVYNQIAADNGGRQLEVNAPRLSQGGGARVTRTANLRSGPGTQYDKVGRLTRGTRVTVLSSANGWSRIVNPNGGQAYIADFLIGRGRGAGPASARIENRPAEKPLPPGRVDDVVLPSNERDKVGDLQAVSLANVEKRDRVYEEVATSKAQTDAFTLS
ncbi:SH3 domain-containing protein [uncultured Rhodospira sp.]|uniref:SH3 domain-containing protein n=1 Tax=uncultured Rhodospira sp. TaxID=1936189 RepID=UPI00262CADF0|nr:SH3 domain-containing protein [uncultured Rhodospira sp.]